MPETSPFTINPAAWSTDESDIAHVRRVVFIEEQAVPETLEWETVDPECAWFIARAADGAVVGTVRLTPDGRIGRMAVLPLWRRRGVGVALLAAVVDEARRRGFDGVRLSAQTHAAPFYARYGFQPEGGVFQDAGIPHIAMTMTFKELE